MQLLWLFLFIGVVQCDDLSDSRVISTTEYNSLALPCAIEYISAYTVSVQTAYITAFECLTSANYFVNYVQSAFSNCDTSSSVVSNSHSELMASLSGTSDNNALQGIDDMIKGLKNDEFKEWNERIDAVAFMTWNYYRKPDVSPTDPGIKLGDAADATTAKTLLITRRFEARMDQFMAEAKALKAFYVSNKVEIDENNVNQEQYSHLVSQYFRAREDIVKKSAVFTAIRYAFMYGIGISLCDGSAQLDEKLLQIYKAQDLSTFFGINDLDSMKLFSQTVTHMYSIYKISSTVLYLNSVGHTPRELSLRILCWEQLNLVRANYEVMCTLILKFIEITQTNIEQKFGKDTEDSKKAMTELFCSVSRMLLVAVKTTEVVYKQTWYYKPDGSMITTSYSSENGIDVIRQFYVQFTWENPNLMSFDVRVINKDSTSLPSSTIILPQDLYQLTVNKLMIQAFFCEINFIIVKIQTSLNNDNNDSTSWIYYSITLKEMEFAMIFAKYTAISNKIMIINTSTYAPTGINLGTNSDTSPGNNPNINPTPNPDGSPAPNPDTSPTSTSPGASPGTSLAGSDSVISGGGNSGGGTNPNTNPGSNSAPYPDSGPTPTRADLSLGNGPHDISVDNKDVSTQITEIMNENSVDIIAILAIHTSDLSTTFQNVETHINQNTKPVLESINYQIGMIAITGTNPVPNSDTSPSSNPVPNPVPNPTPNPDTITPPSPVPTLTPNPVPNSIISPPSSQVPSPTLNSDTSLTPSPVVSSPLNLAPSPVQNSAINPVPNPDSPAPSPGSPVSSPESPAPSPGSPAPSPESPAPSPGSQAPGPNSPTPSPDSSAPNQEISSFANSPDSGPGITFPGNPRTGPTGDSSDTVTTRGTFIRITDSVQITKSIQYFYESITYQFTLTTSAVQSISQTEYSKFIVTSLESCKKQFELNINYLNCVTELFVKYLSTCTVVGSDTYIQALNEFNKDVTEKLVVISSVTDIIFKRITIYRIENCYIPVAPTISYEQFVTQFFSFFKLDFTEMINSSNNKADALLTTVVAKFTTVHQTVITAVQGVQESDYKQMTLTYLEQTITVFKETTDTLMTEITQTQGFISQDSQTIQTAYFQEIVERISIVISIYSTALVKSFTYAQNSQTVNIYKSEGDTTATESSFSEVVTKVTEIKVTRVSNVNLQITQLSPSG
ncbi:Hypothetical protein CINCED_3A008148 [Cinara cedri]|uniref:Uncharacterized protein n=1 Tax=Cinara cedri TaxID=506608 RepID=A0A5E4M517_9HEMI|nr:Hypothetical protein CINCED_3A008148 [Cinara cedri]